MQSAALSHVLKVAQRSHLDGVENAVSNITDSNADRYLVHLAMLIYQRLIMRKDKIVPINLRDCISPQKFVDKRRNALIGFSDNRFPESAIPNAFGLHFSMTLPIQVDTNLDKFLKEIFSRQDLMTIIKDPELLYNEIYYLYTCNGDPSLKFKAPEVIQQTYESWQAIVKELPPFFVRRAYYQTERIKVVDVDPTIFSKKSRKSLALDLAQDFVMFPFNEMIRSQCRVYLNISYDSRVPLVFLMADDNFKHRNDISSLKIAGPFVNRADSAVIYCRSVEVAKEVAEILGKYIKLGFLSSSSQTVPAMTRRISPGVAVSIGAEPKTQGTVYLPSLWVRESKILSFGGIRSQAIAMAILYFRKNITVLGSRYDVFRQSVAIGFKEYGLDPAEPLN